MTVGHSTQPKLRVNGATKVYHTRSGDLLAIDRCSLDIRGRRDRLDRRPVRLRQDHAACGRCPGCMASLPARSCSTATPVTGPNPEIGMVFQEANLLPWRNLDANINFPFEIKGTKPDRVWIDELLNRVGLEGFGGRFPRELSGGMQQRAALVRALVLQAIRPADGRAIRCTRRIHPRGDEPASRGNLARYQNHHRPHHALDR